MITLTGIFTMNHMKKIFTLFLLYLACNLGANSQNIESGKVYRFNNVGKPDRSLSVSPANPAAVGAVTDKSDLKQQWYVVAKEDASGFYLRNASNGGYLTSPRQVYVQWPLTFIDTPDDESMLMTIATIDSHITIRPLTHDNNYGYAHCDGSNNIVGWLSSSTPTQWDAEEVPMTQDQISEMLERFASSGDEIAKAAEYEQALDALFSDKACTTLKVQGDLSANENYLKLPAPLKEMVKKVANNDWAETDGDWDSIHAKKYRVQSYEPYSEGAAAASLAGILAYTNMNNPTGIIANAGQILYVMVDSDIPDGATLYIGGVPDCNMYNNTTSGTRLHKGLNMILCNSDLTHYYIYYTVNTVENKQPVRELKNYEPVTIHIEGGRINGFFNYLGDELYAPDTKNDFHYTTERALHPMYDLIGKYVILHFYLEDTPDVEGRDPQICVKNAFDPELNPSLKHDDPVLTMKAWDDMCFAERILMGIQSDDDIALPFNEDKYESVVNDIHEVGGYKAYPTFNYNDYFNNRMMGLTYQAANLYMNATSWRTAYAPGTVSVILSQFPEDGIWGPAHEYGHMNQGPISIAGTTEESNNVFSNVANYFVCKTTSRCDYPSEQLKNFNAGNTYLQNGTWGTTRMFWQLWCYYHAAGNNKKFYPRLFELLRKYPLVRETTTYDGKLNGKADMLHFVKMCCVAANEDLTDFFDSWGFFFPQDTYHIDDYSVYDLILTKEDIEDVKTEIKSWNLPVNHAIILIDDRVDSGLPTGFGYNRELCGNYGGISDFIQKVSPSGNISYILDGNKITMSGGDPGAGFIILDKEGKLLGFSNSDSFTISDEAALALSFGEAVVKAVGADNSSVIIPDSQRDEEQFELRKQLAEKLDEAGELLDDSGSLEWNEPIEIVFPEDCLYSNALYTGNNADKFTSWSVISDKDVSTYFHSNYDTSKDSDDGLDHYIRMKAPYESKFRFFNLSYTTRQVDNTNTNPKSIVIQASADNENWRSVYRASGMKTGNAVTNETEQISVPSDTKYIRFMVAEASSTLVHGHPYFVVSELSVKDHGLPEFTPSEDYKYLTPSLMKTLFEEITDATLDLDYASTSAEELSSRLESLESAMAAVAQARKLPPVPVESVEIIPSELSVMLNEEPAELKVVILPENASIPDLYWSSSAPEVVGVDSASGELDIKAVGVAEITAATTDGTELRSTCVITVSEPSGISSTFQDKEGVIDVYDINGRVILRQCSSSDLELLEPGLYIIRQGRETKEYIIK